MTDDLLALRCEKKDSDGYKRNMKGRRRKKYYIKVANLHSRGIEPEASSEQAGISAVATAYPDSAN